MLRRISISWCWGPSQALTHGIRMRWELWLSFPVYSFFMSAGTRRRPRRKVVVVAGAKKAGSTVIIVDVTTVAAAAAAAVRVAAAVVAAVGRRRDGRSSRSMSIMENSCLIASLYHLHLRPPTIISCNSNICVKNYVKQSSSYLKEDSRLVSRFRSIQWAINWAFPHHLCHIRTHRIATIFNLTVCTLGSSVRLQDVSLQDVSLQEVSLASV